MTYDDITVQLPLSISNFSELRRKGKIYVDKTELIYSLARRTEKFFLARPRRFGKSLLVSTFDSLFRNGARDFSGLYIENKWVGECNYNVVRLDFLRVKKFSSVADFREKFRAYLKSACCCGYRQFEESTSVTSTNFEIWLRQFELGSVVLLIDEYDAPLTACLSDAVLFEEIRDELTDFYSVIKSNDGYFRFVFMTGITKFNQTGIFSELNHLTDISLDKRYSTLLGYTTEEVERYFSDFIDQASILLNISRDNLVELLKENYDGYCFDGMDEPGDVRKVYTPWSVLRFFSQPKQGFKNYWIESAGKATVLLQYIQDHSLKDPLEYAEERTIDYDDLASSSDLDSINDVALLVQAGYLTIHRREENLFWVGYPNREVAVSMASLYTKLLLGQKSLGNAGVQHLARALTDGDVDLAVDQFNKAYVGINYKQFPVDSESSCRAILHVLITGAGFEAVSEKHNAFGRSDLEFDAGRYHWVIELKFVQSKVSEQGIERILKEAIDQVRDRHYGMNSQRQMIRMALVYSKTVRQFVRWSLVDC